MTLRIACCLCALMALTPARALAQTGALHGSVHDEQSGEELIGANVLLVGTALGAATDLDGKYTIRGIPPGTYDVRITYLGYTAKVVSKVVVRPGDPAKLDVSLREESLQAKDEVVITAERVLATESAVLAERKAAPVIGDVVSAEQIKRSPDATSGDALKRVTGLTVVDNKFVFVRGVTDRYNGTSLNGVAVTSTDTDVDRKSFSFDLVPANLLENTVVVKTMTPDLPGDFSGGLVQVNTLDFPTQLTGKLSFTSGYNSQTTTRTLYGSQGGGRDWLGLDDGSRELPGGGLQGAALAAALPNDWTARRREAPVNTAWNGAIGNRVLRGGQEFGYIGAISYRQGFDTAEFVESPSVIIPGYGPYELFHLEGTRYKRSVLWGALLNLNLKLAGNHKLSLKNNYNQAAEEKVSVSSGRPESSDFITKQVIEWDERSLWLSQLSGEHNLPSLGGLRAEWRLFGSESQAQEPDRKEVEYDGSSGELSLKDNYRTWSDLHEQSRGAGVDLSRSLGRVKLKTGFVTESRERDFGIQAFATDLARLSPANYGLLLLPIDQVFAAENYGPGKFGLLALDSFTGAYAGQFDLQAGYLMGDAPFQLAGKRLRLVAGARLEDARLTVDSYDELNRRPVTADLDDSDVLPSANLTAALDERTNLRLAYGRSLNRPEFRELAATLYYDYDRVQNVQGNPNLARAVVDNYDVRLETFPRPGEVLAASWFYKSIDDAIEESLRPSSERYVRSWFNSSRGSNWGWEVEARKSLGFLHPALANLSITGNYTRVHSAIEYFDQNEQRARERIMQGQAPWTVNLSLLWSSPRLGSAANLLYSRAGRRLDSVGDQRDQDVFEEGRDVLDLALTQKLRQRWEAKFTIRDLLGDDEVLTSGPDELTHERITRGTTYSLALSWSL